MIGIGMALFLVACQEEPVVRRGAGAAAFLEYDSEVSSDERQMVDLAVAYLAERALEGGRVPWFKDLFGGGDSSALLRFLAERVRMVLSEKTEVDSRIRVTGGWQSRAEEQSGRGATNLASLWFLNEALAPGVLRFEINRRWVAFDSTRVGLVQLGPALKRVPRLVQAGVLLHEARHSDCTGGVWRSDIERVKRGEDPEGVACGHLHILCPAGHDYEGLYACDQEAWGAYAVNWIYFLALKRACRDCTFEERSVAELAALDAASRLLLGAQAMLGGSHGVPDMTSSTAVLER
ncbi:MAG: hypothetical protein RJB38_750 [Pseudomonadota bacterium]